MRGPIGKQQSSVGPSSAPTQIPGRCQRILLIDSDKARLSAASKVARAAVTQVVSKAGFSELDASSLQEVDLVIVNYDGLNEQDRLQLLNTFAGEKDDGRLLVYSSRLDHSELATLIGEYGFTNLLARTDSIDSEELLVTMQKILRGDIFGIEKYFSWGAQTRKFEIKCTENLRHIQSEVEQFVEERKIPRRLADCFLLVTDELSTNALYNAPVDEQRKHRFAHFPRTKQVVLEKTEQIDVTICCDGQYIGIAVCDPFGSLAIERVVSYLGKCFRGGEGQMDWKEGGAGLGLYQAYSAVSNFIVNIQEGKRTEMIGLLDVRGSFRDFAKRAKSFNVFVER